MTDTIPDPKETIKENPIFRKLPQIPEEVKQNLSVALVRMLFTQIGGKMISCSAHIVKPRLPFRKPDHQAGELSLI